MRPKLTVIFDRSAFHRERFDLIAASPLLKLTRCNAVLVHHPMAFLEETISMYERESKRPELRKQLPFLLEICNGRWFRARSEIWEIELTQNRGPLANVFEKEWRRRATEATIRKGVFGTTDWKEFQHALPEKDAERKKEANIHRIQASMRQEIALKRRAHPELKRQRIPRPIEFIDTHIDDWGTQIISRYVGRTNRAALACMWRRNKQRYPFLTSSLQGQIFSDWYALVEHNKSIDEHAHVDVEVLSCLNRADAIVSADEKFLRAAFDTLWRPRGKMYFSPEKFVEHLELLSKKHA